MSKPLTSEHIDVADDAAAMEYAWAHGWSDGLPIVPPTPERVAHFLDHAGLAPSQLVGEYRVRNRGITAEKVAINAVMAGCKAEYLPVVLAATEAVTDPAFRLNHIASTSSPWPAFIVNGPVTKAIGMNSGMYVLGPGNRANATIGRAISLVLANCMEAKPGGVQQGIMGNAARMGGMVVAEKDDTAWGPLSAARGFEAGANTVTGVSMWEGGPQQVVAFPAEHFPQGKQAEAFSAVLAEYLSDGYGGGGTDTVILSPIWHKVYLDEGWGRDDLRRYLESHVRTSVGRLKRRRRWIPGPGEQPTIAASAPLKPGDEERYYYPARDKEFDDGSGYERYSFRTAKRDSKERFLFAVAGGEAGQGQPFACIIRAYDAGEPVTKRIRLPGESR